MAASRQKLMWASTFRDIQGLKGEWKLDPRYVESYYFLREKDKKKD